MPLDPAILNAVSHIIGPTSWGTGFLVTVNSEVIEGEKHGYMLTAHHVIEGQDPVNVVVPNRFGNPGEDFYPAVLVDDWRQPLPKVDLALAPFEQSAGRNYSALEIETQMMPNEEIDAAYPMLGANIFYIGLFSPLNKMMARSGTIGALNIQMDHGGSYEYPAHLLDCRSYNGFSGSPCFVQTQYPSSDPIPFPVPIPSEIKDGIALPTLGTMWYFGMLCGMLTEHYADEGYEEDEDDDPERIVSKYGVGVMLRGDEILDALMTDKLREERREKDERQIDDHKRRGLPKPRGLSAKPQSLTHGEIDDALGRATRFVTPNDSPPE